MWRTREANQPVFQDWEHVTLSLKKTTATNHSVKLCHIHSQSFLPFTWAGCNVMVMRKMIIVIAIIMVISFEFL